MNDLRSKVGHLPLFCLLGANAIPLFGVAFCGF